LVFPREAKAAIPATGLKCIAVAKVHQYPEKKYGTALADFVSHARRVEWNSDMTVTAHETTHQIRLETNSYYIGNGCGIILPSSY